MERLPNVEALQLLERMRSKMLRLYPPIDIASDEMMRAVEVLGTYAVGFALREQFWDMWNDWEELGELVGLQGIDEVGCPAIIAHQSKGSVVAT